MFEWYEDEVRGLEKKVFGEANGKAGTTPLQGSVLLYGSSSVRLWDTAASDLGPLTGSAQRPIVNLGFGGSTLGACVHYFDRLPGRVVREQGPIRSLIVYAGENDLGDGQSVDAVYDSFVWLHAMITARLGETPFAFLSVKPSPARANVMERIRVFNARVCERIAERPQSLFIDVYAEMVNADGSPRREYWSADGIHMSRAGYDLWTEILSRYQDTLFR